MCTGPAGPSFRGRAEFRGLRREGRSKITGKLRSRPPLPRLPAQYPAHPACRPHFPNLPSQLSHSCRIHPSAHLYSPPTVLLIPLFRVCTCSSLYVFLRLSCAVNVRSLAVLRITSRAYEPCMQGSSQMVRSTKSTARRGASSKDSPPQVRKRNLNSHE